MQGSEKLGTGGHYSCQRCYLRYGTCTATVLPLSLSLSVLAAARRPLCIRTSRKDLGINLTRCRAKDPSASFGSLPTTHEPQSSSSSSSSSSHQHHSASSHRPSGEKSSQRFREKTQRRAARLLSPTLPVVRVTMSFATAIFSPQSASGCTIICN